MRQVGAQVKSTAEAGTCCRLSTPVWRGKDAPADNEAEAAKQQQKEGMQEFDCIRLKSVSCAG